MTVIAKEQSVIEMRRERETAPAAGSAPAEIVCIGESMVMLGADDGRLAESPVARFYVAGAESNVAAGLAQLGQSVE